MQSHRIQRVRELLKREIGEVIRREISISEAGLISVNDVGVSGDLHSATVFVSIVGTPEQQKKGVGILMRERKRLQSLVSRSVVLKYTPRLRFVVDDSIERGNHVLELIEEIERTLPPE
jgi:ribosome-binding factor A